MGFTQPSGPDADASGRGGARAATGRVRHRREAARETGRGPRYQSALGVELDLERCLAAWRVGGGIEPFEQYKSDIPHATFSQAFRLLVQQTLGRSEAEVEDARLRLRRALGPSAQVVLAIIPELELIIGGKPAIPAVGTLEAQNRLHATFHRFLSVFARPEHPIVLVRDVLDRASAAENVAARLH